MFVVVIKISTGSGRTHVAPPPIDRSIPKTESIDMDSVSRRPWRGRYTPLPVDRRVPRPISGRGHTHIHARPAPLQMLGRGGGPTGARRGSQGRVRAAHEYVLPTLIDMYCTRFRPSCSPRNHQLSTATKFAPFRVQEI
jgi:hypothetical protein